MSDDNLDNTTDDEFECAMCHELFYKGRSDDEALAETEEYFGKLPKEELAVICEDCFQKIHPNKFIPGQKN